MIHFDFNLERNFLFCVFHGKVTPKELANYIDELLKIRSDGGVMRGLVIYAKNVNISDLEYRDIYSAGKMMQKAPFRKNGKNAIITYSKLGYAVGKIYQSVTEVAGLDETKVFNWVFFNEATEWLGVSHLQSHVKEVIERCESGVSVPNVHKYLMSA